MKFSAPLVSPSLRRNSGSPDVASIKPIKAACPIALQEFSQIWRALLVSVSTRHNNAGDVGCVPAKGFTMGPHIDAFCGEICLKLVDIDEELQYLKIAIREKARRAEPEVRSRLEKVTKRIAFNQSRVAAARAQVEHWVTNKAKDDPRFRNEEISEERNGNLKRTAEADRYAAACIDLAVAAVDEAERAALEAWLVREDANSSRCEPQKYEAMA